MRMVKKVPKEKRPLQTHFRIGIDSLVYMNPLKSGKLEAYKKFIATFLGPRKAEYIDLLKRYDVSTLFRTRIHAAL